MIPFIKRKTHSIKKYKNWAMSQNQHNRFFFEKKKTKDQLLKSKS
jgi:hypothetical protein